MKYLWTLSIFTSFMLQLDACSRLFWNEPVGVKLVARTMDLFISDEPEMWLKPRGLSHKSEADNQGIAWTSTYGSIVISAFGHENFITDGVNEKGLSIHMLALQETEYETRDERESLYYGEWIQYLLDTSETVEEAIAAHQSFQIVPLPLDNFVWPIHIALEDRSGDSAIIEFVEGKMEVYHGSRYNVCTNGPTYNEHLLNLEKKELFSSKKTDSISRFIRGHLQLSKLEEPQDTSDGIKKLRSAITPLFQDSPTTFLGKDYLLQTLWTVIVDLNDPTYYFFHEGSKQSFSISLSELDLSREGSLKLFSGLKGKEPLFSQEMTPFTLSKDA